MNIAFCSVFDICLVVLKLESYYHVSTCTYFLLLLFFRKDILTNVVIIVSGISFVLAPNLRINIE